MLDFLYRWTFYISCLPCSGEIGRAAILVQKARFFSSHVCSQPPLQPAAAAASRRCTVFFTSLYPE
jgi:hypothetical protein